MNRVLFCATAGTIMALSGACARAQQLEDHKSAATSGTVATPSRLSGGNLSSGSGPASEDHTRLGSGGKDDPAAAGNASSAPAGVTGGLKVH